MWERKLHFPSERIKRGRRGGQNSGHAYYRQRWIMDQPILRDKDQFPTEEVIFSHIGRSRLLWKLLFDRMRRDHPDFTEEWRYYNDGKSWLLKVQKKSKTVFWLAVVKGGFRTTFYFPDKAAKAISTSEISGELKTQYRDGPRYGKIRGITIVHKKKRDVEDATRLIEMKLAIR
jgi:hypothetical protein